MLATVHLADVGPLTALRTVVRRRTALADVAGLRWGQVALAAPLAASRPPSPRRVGLIAFWDDDAAVDAFVASHPLGRALDAGLHARMRPLRAYGSWPGLPGDIPQTRAVPHDGPVAVLTLGRLRLSQTRRFLKTSRQAEKSAVDDPDMLWGTAAARPPFVATISLWRSGKASAAYAYGRQRPAHSEAIAEQQRKDFHVQSAFIRFAIDRIDGRLDGRNPFDAATVSSSA